MELMVNPSDENLNSFNAQLGISLERSKEIATFLDSLDEKYRGKMVIVGLIFKEIAEFCNTNEELVFATISHCGYMAVRYNLILCPPGPRKRPDLPPLNLNSN